ncbi:hypothetical protein LOAG_13555, partial [Loa loa]
SNKSNDILPITLILHKPINFCLRILLDPKIGLGEAYMFENWDTQLRIQDFLALLIRAKTLQLINTISYNNGMKKSEQIISFINFIQHYYHTNSLYGSARNIHKHYDLGNDMFSLFLDPSMTYSCAIFQAIPSHTIINSDNKLLEEAQNEKI